MMKYVLAISMMMAGAVVNAQLSAPVLSTLDSMVKDYEKEKYFSGVLMISQNGKTLYSKSIGFADLENRIPNNLHTNFNIASTGKTFTAVMIMQLVQEGKLKLDEPIKSYLPEFAIKNADRVTIHHLLTHTSGVNNYMMHPDFKEKMSSLKSLDSVMTLVTDMPLTQQEPGKEFDYSNSGYIILGKIIEKLTGKDYLNNLQERIFTKVKIDHSHIHYPATFKAPQEAVPYYVYSGKTWRNGAKDEYPGFSDGGMQSNAVDLTRFGEGLLNNTLLEPGYRKMLWTGKVEFGRGGKYAYGWMENENPYGKHIISHDGGGHGFSADLKIVEEDGYIIVVLINNHLNPREVSNNIVRVLYTGRYEKPRKYLEYILFEKIEQRGWPWVKENFNAILKEEKLDSVPNVWVYISLVDFLTDNKYWKEAEEVAAMGRSDFPKESGIYNLTGQLFRNMGEAEEAKKWYQKALEINSQDDFAKNALQEIEKK